MTEDEFISKAQNIAGFSVMLDDDGTIGIDTYLSVQDLEQLAALLSEYLRCKKQSKAAQYLQTVDKGLIVGVKV